jgi:hypothetical protein
MKARLEFILQDDDTISATIDNPGNVPVWSIIGLLEKIKTEVILTTPTPEVEGN